MSLQVPYSLKHVVSVCLKNMSICTGRATIVSWIEWYCHPLEHKVCLLCSSRGTDPPTPVNFAESQNMISHLWFAKVVLVGQSVGFAWSGELPEENQGNWIKMRKRGGARKRLAQTKRGDRRARVTSNHPMTTRRDPEMSQLRRATTCHEWHTRGTSLSRCTPVLSSWTMWCRQSYLFFSLIYWPSLADNAPSSETTTIRWLRQAHSALLDELFCSDANLDDCMTDCSRIAQSRKLLIDYATIRYMFHLRQCLHTKTTRIQRKRWEAGSTFRGRDLRRLLMANYPHLNDSCIKRWPSAYCSKKYIGFNIRYNYNWRWTHNE